MESRRDVFQAIADPTRRGILTMLIQQPRNLNAIAENFNMTRQGISLHVKILEECNVISIRRQGRERYCDLNAKKIAEIADWLEPFQKMWEGRFSQLDNLLHTLKRKSK